MLKADVEADFKTRELLPPSLFEIDALLVALKIAAQRAGGLATINDHLEFVEIVI